jgi:hypothetical protein
MSLKKQLKELQQQKREELNCLHVTYLRTKRDVKRSVSPDRFVRRHLGATLGGAAVLGLLLAPRPAPRVVPAKEKAEKPKGPSALGRVGQILKKSLGNLEDMIPTPHTDKGKVNGHNGHDKDAKKKKVSGLLQSLLTVLVSRIDLNKLISETTRTMAAKMQPPGAAKGNGHSPQVSVADVGTIKPQEYENFE